MLFVFFITFLTDSTPILLHLVKGSCRTGSIIIDILSGKKPDIRDFKRLQAVSVRLGAFPTTFTQKGG